MDSNNGDEANNIEELKDSAEPAELNDAGQPVCDQNVNDGQASDDAGMDDGQDEQPLDDAGIDDGQDEQPLDDAGIDDGQDEQPLDNDCIDDERDDQPLDDADMNDGQDEQPLDDAGMDDRQDEQPLDDAGEKDMGENAPQAGDPDEDQPAYSDEQLAVALQHKPEYSLRDFGLVCICSEFMWFFGSQWAISMVRSLGINAVTAQYIVAVLWFPLTMFAIPYTYMRMKGLDSEKFVGLCGKFKGVDILVVGLASFAVWAMLRLPEMYWAQLISFIFGSNVPHIRGIGAYDTVFIIDFIRKCIVPAFFEEYLYRGILYRSLRGGIGAGRAAILSSVIFMLMHTDLKNVMAPIALGLLCAYLLESTGSLYPCMLSHFIYNCSSTIGNLSVASRSNGMESGWGAGLPITLLMVVSCTVLLAMCLYMIHKSGRCENSISIDEYAVCKRSRFDLLPFFILCVMLVAGYFF